MVKELQKQEYQCEQCKRNISHPTSNIWFGMRTGWIYIKCEHCGYDTKIGNS